MKAIKNKWYGLYVSILSTFLGILGLNSCAEEHPLAYGPLFNGYAVLYDGTVTDENDDPIEGAKISFRTLSKTGKVLETSNKIVVTNEQGKFIVGDTLDIYPPDRYRIIATDPNDPEVKDSVEATSTYDGYKWAHIVKANIKLKKKK